MAVGELFQLGRVRRITGLDLARLRQAELFEENALELRNGVDVELLSGEILNRRFQARHFLAEVGIELIEIFAIDENAGMLHARKHGDQWEFQLRSQIPRALGAQLRL